jgi:hypothetical protein
MKISLVLVVLIILNTSALLSEPLAQLVKGVNSWLFIGVEVLLLIAYYIHGVLKGLFEVGQIEYGNLNLFVVKSDIKKPKKEK